VSAICLAPQGVEQDYQKALEWHTKAAEQEHVASLFNLAQMYNEGEGVEQDFPKAVELYTKAAKLGFVSAQFHLAAMYNDIEQKKIEKSNNPSAVHP